MKKNVYRSFALALLSCWATAAFGQTDITESGATASTQFNDSPANETISKLTDNSSATKYLTFNSAAWVQYRAAQPYVVTKYSLTSANDFPARDPKNWTLQGSTNGTTWTTINTQSNQVFATRFLRKEYSFTNTVAYSYYRLNFTNSSGTILQLAELEIFGTVPVSNSIRDITNLTGQITTQHNGSPAEESVEKVIDNMASTKFLTFNASAWIKFQCGNPAVVTRYTITSANDADTRDPLNWTFQGSSDNTNWTTLDSRNNEDFATRLLKREFSFSNTKAFTYFRLNMTNNSGTILQLAEWEIFGTGGGGVIPIPTPPATWQEHWHDHTQLVSLVYHDNDVAVYFDKDVNRSVTWPFKFFGDIWRYTKSVYGDFGKDPRLYAVLHTGRHSGGHPAGYLSASHDYRNVLDVGPGPFSTFDYNAVAIPTHEAAHIVEGASKGVEGSPAFGIWGDSKWAEIYNYDVYLALGKTDWATKWYNEQIARSDAFPRANTFWFRDWFYPIYNQYGKAQVLNRYFTLLSQCFPKNGKSYSRGMNWGEFIHFWSGAAGVNLKSMATNAFGWPAEYEAQFKKAQTDFPCFTYANAAVRLDDPEVAGSAKDANVSVWYNQNAKVVSIVDENSKVLEGSVHIYSLLGKEEIKSLFNKASNVATIEAGNLTPGVYIVIVEANKTSYRKRIVVK